MYIHVYMYAELAESRDSVLILHMYLHMHIYICITICISI